MGDAEITLLTVIGYETDEKGFEVEVYEGTDIFADEGSIRSNEFYEAQRQGLKLTKMFIIKPYEYENQQELIFEGIKYKVERTYQKNTEELELICSTVE